MSDLNSSYISEQISRVTRDNGQGSHNARAAEALWGVSSRVNPLYLPTATDNNGYTFITKFDLNLQDSNITQDREFADLLTGDDLTYQRAIRAYLDPYGATESGYPSRLVDNLSPWISVLSNSLISVSGFPDNTMSSYVSPEGIMGEVWSVIDGVYRIRGPYSVTTTFNNIEGGIIPRLFHTIGLYSENIMADRMMPYPWNQGGITMDNTTCIWRLVTDPSRRFVRHIGHTGYCFPRVNPMGAMFNFNSEDNFITDNRTIGIEWQCVGAVYNDPLSFTIFNYLSFMFNPDLKIINERQLAIEGIRIRGEKSYYRVTPNNIDKLSGYCYPLINPATHEITWFIKRDVFNRLTGYQEESVYTQTIPDGWQPPDVL